MANQELIKQLGAKIYNAHAKKEPIEPLSQQYDLTVVDAYHIQLDTIERFLAEGQTISGKKIGLTSLPMQEMFGVSEPDYGHIFSQSGYDDGVVEHESLMQPKVEGEIAFILKEDLIGPNVTAEEVLEKTDYVVGAIEIVDSRIKDWQIALVDTVADNASYGGYVLGNIMIDPKEIDLKNIKMDFYKNGELINSGQGSDVLGDPAYCVAWLANKMSEFNIPLKKGEVILSGALTAALVCEKGDVFEAKFSELGTVSCEFK